MADVLPEIGVDNGPESAQDNGPLDIPVDNGWNGVAHLIASYPLGSFVLGSSVLGTARQYSTATSSLVVDNGEAN